MLEFHSGNGNGTLDLLHRGYNLSYSFYSLMYDTLCCLAAVEESSANHTIILCPLDAIDLESFENVQLEYSEGFFCQIESCSSL